MTDTHRHGTGTVPAPRTGRYEIDPDGSRVEFRTRHLFGLAGVRGSFAIRSGVVDVVDPIAASRIRVEIDTASFHTGNGQRDATVRSARFLDAGRYPTMTFGSDRLDGDRAALAGMLTVRAVTRPVTLERLAVEPAGPGGVAGGPGSFVARATTRIDRTEFGLTASPGLAGRYLDVSLRVVCLRR